MWIEIDICLKDMHQSQKGLGSIVTHMGRNISYFPFNDAFVKRTGVEHIGRRFAIPSTSNAQTRNLNQKMERVRIDRPPAILEATIKTFRIVIEVVVRMATIDLQTVRYCIQRKPSAISAFSSDSNL